VDPQQVQRDYQLLEVEYQRRLGSPGARHRLDDEITGLELEETSYRLARQYERQGRLAEAAHWLRTAATVDYADAAARLARVLDRLGYQEGAAYWRAVADDVPVSACDTEADEVGHTMGCGTVQAHADQYLRHELPTADLAAIRQHLLKCQRCLETYAARRTATSGQQHADLITADLLTQRGHIDEAIAVLQTRAEAGDEYASWKLANLLAEHGRIDEAIAILQVQADQGREYAVSRVVDLRAGRSHPGSMRPRLATHPGTSAGIGAAAGSTPEAAGSSSGEAAGSTAPLLVGESGPRPGTSDLAEPFGRQGHPVVLYRERDTTVTTTFFEFGGYRFPLAELTDLERVEHGGWLQTRRFELWARFRQQRIRLFSCYQATEFGRVCRALTRARQYAGLA
jgi:tetratricopeptide (TPR) repeat protein